MSQQPRHGSRQRYTAGCRCDRCTLANARMWQRHNDWQRGRTEPPLTDVEELKRHLRSLRNRLSLDTIEHVTGVSRPILEQAMRGEGVAPQEAVAILAMDLDDLDRLPDELVLPSKPTWQRIDRIRAKTGWTQKQVAEQLGFTVLHRREGVTVANARLVRDLFYRLCGIRCAMCGGPLAFHPIMRRCEGRRPS